MALSSRFVTLAILVGILLFPGARSTDRAELEVISHPPVDLSPPAEVMAETDFPEEEVKIPSIQITSPIPQEMHAPGAAFFYIRYSEADQVNLTTTDITVASERELGCDSALTKLSEETYAVTILNCKGSGHLTIRIPNGTAQNILGESKEGDVESEALMVLPEKVSVKVVQMPAEPISCPAPVTPPPTEKVGFEYNPPAEIQAHEVSVPRPKSGMFEVRTDMTTYYYKTDDPSTVITVKRPVGGNRFVIIKHIEDSGKISLWRRSDHRGVLFEPNPAGEFKIDLIDLEKAQTITVEPLYLR